MKGMEWRKNIEEACTEIEGGTRQLMLFFQHPDCEGSKKMIKETLADERVVGVIERDTAPLIFNTAIEADLARKYRVDWTPTFIIADEKGNELERWVGYLPPEDFIAQLELSKGLSAFHLGRYEETVRDMQELVDDHPKSELVPEAEYYLGAAIYKMKGDAYQLGEICDTLMDTFPESLWTKKCSVWAHLAEERKSFVAFDTGGSAGSGAY
ncbi:MAG: thioredoxin fold domain-containing protein [Deltaproteobacteria bacterium]|nr:thioredoxin fold domain-containing protein [Deltaproteobacteria bacterium]